MSNPIRIHQTFIGQDMTDLQREFYSDQSLRGFSTKELDPDLTDSTLILALALAKEEGKDSYYPVTIYTSSGHRKWVAERIRNLAVHFMSRVQALKDKEKLKKTMVIAQGWLGGLLVGTPKLADLEVAPERWVAVGYTREDAIPEWFKKALL